MVAYRFYDSFVRKSVYWILESQNQKEGGISQENQLINVEMI